VKQPCGAAYCLDRCQEQRSTPAESNGNSNHADKLEPDSLPFPLVLKPHTCRFGKIYHAGPLWCERSVQTSSQMKAKWVNASSLDCTLSSPDEPECNPASSVCTQAILFIVPYYLNYIFGS
ncbi:hypothetical protein CEXT_270381, partial [Caerostris extrusa]